MERFVEQIVHGSVIIGLVIYKERWGNNHQRQVR